jgi:hypothetical protein
MNKLKVMPPYLTFARTYVFTESGRARAGTNLENMSVAQIVVSTAPHESQTLAFNYASLALNNSFFLHHLVSQCPPRSSFIINN